MQLCLLTESIKTDFLKPSLPLFRVGSVVRVDVIIQEGEKKRVQSYTGLLSNHHKAGSNSTITVQRFSKGIRVTRVFPVHSPDIKKIEVVQSVN